MKDNVLLILTKFTTIFLNTIIAIPFTSNNLFHVKVININSPGSNPKSYVPALGACAPRLQPPPPSQPLPPPTPLPLALPPNYNQATQGRSLA